MKPSEVIYKAEHHFGNGIYFQGFDLCCICLGKTEVYTEGMGLMDYKIENDIYCSLECEGFDEN